MGAGPRPGDERAESGFEKFVVDQPPPGGFQCVLALGHVDVPLGVGMGAEGARPQDFGWQEIGIVGCKQVQGCRDVLCNLPGADAFRHAPDGVQGGQRFAGFDAFRCRRRHGEGVIPFALDLAPEAVFCADFKCVLQEILVEIDDFAGCAFIVCPEF